MLSRLGTGISMLEPRLSQEFVYHKHSIKTIFCILFVCMTSGLEVSTSLITFLDYPLVGDITGVLPNHCMTFYVFDTTCIQKVNNFQIQIDLFKSQTKCFHDF